MPSHKQTTVESPITDRGMGAAATNDLKTMFATSPMHSGDITPDSVKEQYQKEALDDQINDGGHTFGTFDPNYTDAPDMGDVETGGGGAPASPFVPNPSSPGEGSVSPTDQPKAPDGFGETPSATPFSGVGSKLNPKVSSIAIGSQTLGDYGLGKSS